MSFILFLIACPNNKDLRKELIDYIISNENINLALGNKVKKLKLTLKKGSWSSLNVLGKFV